MNSHQDISRLFEAYCDGSLSPADARFLARQIGENEAWRAWFLEELRLAGTLAMVFDKTTEDMVVRSVLEGCRALSSREEFTASVQHIALRTAKKQRQRLAWRHKFLPLAASLLAALGAGLWLSRTALQTPAPYGAVARVESVQGSVFGVQDADPRPRALHAGDEILAGMRIETGADSAATLAWLTEAATVELAADSKLETRSSQRSFLHQGQLSAAVGPQPPDQPFEVETPHALATVLGTRLRMQVGEWKRGTLPETRDSKRETGERVSGARPSAINHQPSTIPSAIPFSRLDVEEGLVRIARHADQERLDVAAGRFAVVGEDDAAFAFKTYPLDAEWVDGPVIFRDDFEQGLGQWKVFLSQRLPDGRYREVAKSPEDKAQVRIRAEAGRSPGSGALEMHNAYGSDMVVSARPLDDPTSKNFMIEFYFKPLASFGLDCFHTTAMKPAQHFPICAEQKKKAQDSILSKQWHLWRQEYRARIREDGTTYLEGKSIHNGFLNQHWEYEQIDEYYTCLSLRLGRVLIDNYVVRELIAVGNPQETQLPSGGTP